MQLPDPEKELTLCLLLDIGPFHELARVLPYGGLLEPPCCRTKQRCTGKRRGLEQAGTRERIGQLPKLLNCFGPCGRRRGNARAFSLCRRLMYLGVFLSIPLTKARRGMGAPLPTLVLTFTRGVRSQRFMHGCGPQPSFLVLGRRGGGAKRQTLTPHKQHGRASLNHVMPIS